jgi:DNA-binding NarL/FixJ family response regulator
MTEGQAIAYALAEGSAYPYVEDDEPESGSGRAADRVAGGIPDALPGYPDHLSEREVDVLRLIAAGESNKEIAAALSLSLRTVERHTVHIYAKIGARGRADAVAYAHRHHLLSSP